MNNIKEDISWEHIIKQLAKITGSSVKEIEKILKKHGGASRKLGPQIKQKKI